MATPTMKCPVASATLAASVVPRVRGASRAPTQAAAVAGRRAAYFATSSRAQVFCSAADDDREGRKSDSFYVPDDKNDAASWYGGTPTTAAVPQPQILNVDELRTLGSSFGGVAEGVEVLEPQTASQAIERGQVFCRRGKYQEALSLFQCALDLPGSGVVQAYYRKSEPVIKTSQPLVTRETRRQLSNEEKIAIHYNIACSYSRLSEEEEDKAGESEKLKLAFENLEIACELGYKDMDMIQQEEDFEAMRKKLPTAFQALVAKYAKKGNFFGNFMSGFNLDQYVERK